MCDDSFLRWYGDNGEMLVKYECVWSKSLCKIYSKKYYGSGIICKHKNEPWH